MPLVYKANGAWKKKKTINQSEKKPKLYKYPIREPPLWWRLSLPSPETRLTSLALLVDVVEFMKQMNPQQLANIHIKKTKLNALIAIFFLLPTRGSSRRVKTDIFQCIIRIMSMANNNRFP